MAEFAMFVVSCGASMAFVESHCKNTLTFALDGSSLTVISTAAQCGGNDEKSLAYSSGVILRHGDGEQSIGDDSGPALFNSAIFFSMASANLGASVLLMIAH